jgi:hypothetical protein
MPFIKTPPSAVVDAFIKEVSTHGITVERATLEQDLDRVMFGAEMRKSLEAQLKNMNMPGIEAELDALYPESPTMKVVRIAIEKHFKGYFA